MRLILIFIILSLLFNGCNAKNTIADKEINITKNDTNKFIPHQFNSLWQEIKSDRYLKLPQYKLSYSKIKDKIKGNAIRTLEDRRDLIEPFDKLAHPNGICLKGLWQIDTQNPYSGYFTKNSKALVIARISTAFDGTKYSDNRSFGMALKLFASTNQNQTLTQNSANIFTIDDLGGHKNRYFSQTKLTNAPPLSFSWELLKNIFYNIKLTTAFNSADKNAGIRELYEISELKNPDDKTSKIITPKYIELKLISKIDKKDDFRDELKIDKKPLIFSIKVSDDKKSWKKIGTITFDESVVSYSCDHRLHFHHPKSLK